MADIARIEDRIDRVAIGAMEVSDALGGLRFQNMVEVMEFAKMMSVAGNAVPKHLQGNPGMCLAVCVQALEWRFSPFAVANKSYEVQQRLSFESQLVHAVIEQRAPITGRLRHSFEGEGDQRVCIVTARLRETGEILEYKSPPFVKITPKNSPLWKTKPDLQHYYNTSRDFCRVYFPDVLLGVYADDELRDHIGPDNAKDVTDKPDVASRLRGNKGRGFSAAHVERETTRGVVDETATRNTEAQREAGDGPSPVKAASEQASVSTDAGATDQPQSVLRSPQPNSDQVSPPEPDPKPAPETLSVPSAGTNSTSAPEGVATRLPDAEPKQAGGGGDDAVANVIGLPADWPTQYAAALGAAQTVGSLTRYAASFWKARGGYERVKADKPTYEKAEAVYAAFRDHFGPANEERRNALLQEIGAA